ncbi:unnamed protein product [Discula destructiva]
MAHSFYIKTAITVLLAASQATAASPEASDDSDSGFIMKTETDKNISSVTLGSMTSLASTDAAATSCGSQKYTDATYFVAVNAGQLFCGDTGKGTPIVMYCNGKEVLGTAADECKDCESSEMQVQSTVWAACGFSTADAGASQTANWTITPLITDFQGLIGA